MGNSIFINELQIFSRKLPHHSFRRAGTDFLGPPWPLADMDQPTAGRSAREIVGMLRDWA